MPYDILRSPNARHDIRHYFRYLKREAGEETAHSFLLALEYDIRMVIAYSPLLFSWFHETGKPHRAKLFKLARATFWIVYVVDDARRCIEIERFWNATRKPETHEL